MNDRFRERQSRPVRSPVNGYITNLQVQEGDYATADVRNLSVLNSDSFWVYGYFEKTKIGAIKPGDPVSVLLMGYRDPIRGHVESIARAINTPNTAPGAKVSPQSIPSSPGSASPSESPCASTSTRCPPTVTIAVGMTATVTVGPGAGPASSHSLIPAAACLDLHPVTVGDGLVARGLCDQSVPGCWTSQFQASQQASTMAS